MAIGFRRFLNDRPFGENATDAIARFCGSLTVTACQRHALLLAG